MSKVKPKVCAVCAQVLDQSPTGEWIHTRELIGASDHRSIPVDYDSVEVRTMCDFCYSEVPKPEIFTVPASDFKVPLIGTISVGGWAACPPCAKLIAAAQWDRLTDRAAKAFVGRQGGNEASIRGWLSQLYAMLSQHMTGPVRPWEPGDEEVPER